MRKKILFQSDFSLLKTGFAKNAKSVLTYLYKTGKYEIVHFCVGITENATELQRTPWKSIGCVPKITEKNKKLFLDENLKKRMGYGAFSLDDVILSEKPDVYIAAQDIWGVDFAVEKTWFNKINSVIWTTLDSLPLLPSAIEVAKKTKNYWLWSSFATEELHRMGHKHSKTVHGAIDCSNFFRLDDDAKKRLRKENGIKEDCFVVGFVFRNQPRKTISSLLKGFKKFKDHHENAKLLLHTSYSEGWDICRFNEEFGVSEEDVLVSHFCSNCFAYEVKPYEKQNKKCLKCNSNESLDTVNIVNGVSDSQLNEIYNIMDVYCHPFTSGGQEIPVQEAKLTELITLVTKYSCGEEACHKEAFSFPLEWTEYREVNSNFIKAYTSFESIFEQLEKVFIMKRGDRLLMGKQAREWAIQNYSIENVGKFIENFIDNECCEVDGSAFFELEAKDPKALINDDLDDASWVKSLYKNILKINLDNEEKQKDNVDSWVNKLKEGASRKSVEKYFRKGATQVNDSKDKLLFDFLDFKDSNKRILYILPNEKALVYSSVGFFKSIKQKHPHHDLYVAGNNGDDCFLYYNDYVKDFLPKEKIETEEFFKENREKKVFDIIFAPHLVNKFDFIFLNHE